MKAVNLHWQKVVMEIHLHTSAQEGRFMWHHTTQQLHNISDFSIWTLSQMFCISCKNLTYFVCRERGCHYLHVDKAECETESSVHGCHIFKPSEHVCASHYCNWTKLHSFCGLFNFGLKINKKTWQIGGYGNFKIYIGNFWGVLCMSDMKENEYV